MLYKMLMYGMMVGKLSHFGLSKFQAMKKIYTVGKHADRRLLYLLLVPPALLLARFAVNKTSQESVKPLGSSLLGLAGARLELAGLRMKMMLQGLK